LKKKTSITDESQMCWLNTKKMWALPATALSDSQDDGLTVKPTSEEAQNYCFLKIWAFYYRLAILAVNL